MKRHFELALVTGATSGIGEAMAAELAASGTPLILTGRNQKRLDEMQQRLSSTVPVQCLAADLAKGDERRLLIELIREKSPSLIINSAGWGYYGEALSYPTEISMNVAELDLMAVQEITLESARSMVAAKKEGVILNVSSAAAFQVFPGFSVYAASKAFVTLFSESLDAELSPLGVRVLAACPGPVRTSFGFRASGEQGGRKNPFAMSVEKAAREICWQIERGKAVHIFDWRSRAATFLSRYCLPNSLIAWFTHRWIEKRQGQRKILVD